MPKCLKRRKNGSKIKLCIYFSSASTQNVSVNSPATQLVTTMTLRCNSYLQLCLSHLLFLFSCRYSKMLNLFRFSIIFSSSGQTSDVFMPRICVRWTRIAGVVLEHNDHIVDFHPNSAQGQSHVCHFIGNFTIFQLRVFMEED